MTLAQLDLIEHKHYQKYRHSCAGSLCEMLLKLNGALEEDSTDYQDANPDSRRSVSDYVEKPLQGGLTMRRIQPVPDWEFPLDAMKAELAAGVQVGVFENTPGQVHGWIVEESDQTHREKKWCI